MTVLYTRFKKMCSLDCVSSRRMMMVPLLLGDLSYRLWKSEGGGGVSLSLSHWCSKGRATTRSSVVVDQKKKIQKRTTTTTRRRRRHKARFFCVEMICVVVVVSKKKKKECVCFVAPFNTKCRREYRRGTYKARERRRSHTKKRNKIYISKKKKEISQNI